MDQCRLEFQSTRPVWGATFSRYHFVGVGVFQSTRPVWGATCNCPIVETGLVNFNPRAPCGARLSGDHSTLHRKNFNPRAPCGARRFKTRSVFWFGHFNPRAPCGARRLSWCMPIPSVKFQSTRPVWGATLHRFPSQTRCQISIHAPRVGRDDSPSWLLLLPLQFQSTRPVWGATPERVYVVTSFIFQSTRPVLGATNAVNHRTVRPLFQSTRPVWGATVCTSRASGNTS